MDRRTKILAIGFGAVIAIVILSKTVYPNWIKPLLTLDERIAEREEERERLLEIQHNIEKARIEYRDLVSRNGSFEPGRVETAVRDRINALIDKHKLQDANVAPSRPVPDRKTGLISAVITVTATASLESVVSFLKDLSELPELVRVGNPAISPVASTRRSDKKDQMNFRVPVEMLILPQNKVVGRIEESALQKPENFVRHAGRGYKEIWDKTPFTEFVDLPPLRVDVQKMANFEVGQQAFIQATPSGGEQNYTVKWEPAEGLTEPSSARTGVDTSTARTQTYTVTVTDTARDSKPVSATVAVTIKEPKPPTPAPVEPQQVVEKTPPAPVERRDPEGRSKQIVMTLLQNAGTKRTRELMIVNSRNKETTYHKAGEDFDGGKLIFVHQTGGLVNTKGKYYIYPLGANLEERMEYQNAVEYTELRAAAEKSIALETARADAARKKSIVEPDPAVVEPGGPEGTLDSRGGDEPPAETKIGPEPVPVEGPQLGEAAKVVPPAAAPARAVRPEGPVISESTDQPADGDALMGPPANPQRAPARRQPATQPANQPKPARPAEPSEAKPAPAKTTPTPAQQPPRGGNTRPKPNKGRGRI